MELSELTRLRVELDEFVAEYRDCVKTKPSRKHMRTYVSGLLGPLKRKNVEAIALEAGVPVRTLQEFLSLHRWDDLAVGRRTRELVRRRHSSDDAIAVIDETSFAKKGKKTAGVKRQYCGATGKIDNCVVSVHLGYVADQFQALLDGELFLPEEWVANPARCAEAAVPKKAIYRPKWKIALDLLERSLSEGVHFRWLTADELYGRTSAFRERVAELGLTYVVEVPCTTKGWTKRPRVEPAGLRLMRGPARSRARVARGERECRQADSLWKRGGPSWQVFRVKDTEKGPEVWRVRETRFHPWKREGSRGIPGPKSRLVIAKNVLSQETKYFLTNAGSEIALAEVLRIAFSRACIEQLFREAKGAVGLDEFQVRSHRSLNRHLVLTAASLLFLAEQTERLRGKKPVVERVPGARSGRASAGPCVFATRATPTAGTSPQTPRIPAQASC